MGIHFWIKNWRCIESLSLNLSNVNVFIGKNSTGKSSTIYGLYFLAKIAKGYDINNLAQNLYGLPIQDLIRSNGTKKYSPVEISIDDDGLVFTYDDKNKIDIKKLPKATPWSDSFLLPSRRIGLFETANFLNKFLRYASKEILSFAGFLVELIRRFLVETPLLPPLPLFLSDYMRAIHGVEEKVEIKYTEKIGVLSIFKSPLLWMVEYYIDDPFLSNVRMPLEGAPEGALDFLLIKPVLEKAPERSLIVLEEPENNKNPTMQMELVKYLAEVSLKKNLTLVMTTHSEIVPLTLAKLVESRVISKDDVKIYYLTRTIENPWTQAKMIEIYDDGSMDILPDSKELTIKLF